MAHEESGEERTQTAPSQAPEASLTPVLIELADRDWDIEVKPQNVFGHGLTGRWSWAIVRRSEFRPRIRFGVSATRERALFDVGWALGQLVAPEASD